MTFISWAKYTDWMYKVAEDWFDRSVVVRYKIQKPKEYKYYETERKMPKYGKIRTIVVQREADRKRSVIYTNAGKEKEILSALSMILNRGGHVKLQGGVLRVAAWGASRTPRLTTPS